MLDLEQFMKERLGPILGNGPVSVTPTAERLGVDITNPEIAAAVAEADEAAAETAQLRAELARLEAKLAPTPAPSPAVEESAVLQELAELRAAVARVNQNTAPRQSLDQRLKNLMGGPRGFFDSPSN